MKFHICERNYELANEKRFPWGINIGSLKNDNGSCTAMLPTDAGGLFVCSEQKDDMRVTDLAEWICCNVITTLVHKAVKISVCDDSNRKVFTQLEKLSHLGIYQIFNNEKEFEDAQCELKELIRERHHGYLSEETSTMSDFNQRIDYVQPYQIVVLNLDKVCQQISELQLLESFIEDAFAAGIFFVFMGNFVNSKNDEDYDLIASKVTSKYPKLKFSSDGLEILPHQTTTQLLKLMSQYEYEINGASVSKENKSACADLVGQIIEENQTAQAEADFLTVPIGKKLDGITEVHFSLGAQSECYSALVVGAPGSGKSTLMNNIILRIADQFTSDEMQLYLMDYKDGVEFNLFKNHPNCQQIYLDNSNTDGARDLLNSFAGSMQERNEMFKQKGVRDIDEYNALDCDQKIPRVLLVIDEVQTLLTGKGSSEFEKLLVNVLRKGRSAGIHTIISTQTLAGFFLSNEILDLIPLRIAFRLVSDGDCDKVFHYNNYVARNLEKYQFLYNGKQGNKSDNVVGWGDPPLFRNIKDVESYLDEIVKRRSSVGCIKPIVIDNYTTHKESFENISHEKVIEDTNSTWFSFKNTEYVSEINLDIDDLVREEEKREKEQGDNGMPYDDFLALMEQE